MENWQEAFLFDNKFFQKTEKNLKKQVKTLAFFFLIRYNKQAVEKRAK